MAHILLVEDETNFGAVLKDYLSMNNFEVSLARDGEEGLAMFRSKACDLCILDVMMPRKDGFTLAKEIREINSDIPIIFLTARTLKEDVLEGFKLGGDDYITKPFDSEELLYRVKAVLKRAEKNNKVGDHLPHGFEFGDFSFDHKLHTLYYEGDNQRLSPKEADLLRLLLLQKNDLLSRQEALKTLWGDDNYFNARSMDVFISKLRKRFKPDPRIKIENVHGRGFRMVVPEE